MTKVYGNGTLIATCVYDANGSRESPTYGNGITAAYAYNKSSMVTSLNNKHGTTPVSSYVYTYYLDGNQETKTDDTGKTTTYIEGAMTRRGCSILFFTTVLFRWLRRDTIKG